LKTRNRLPLNCPTLPGTRRAPLSPDRHGNLCSEAADRLAIRTEEMGSDTNGINARTMRFVARDRLVSRRYVRPWKSLHNGQQSIATRARMNSNKGLEKRRQRGLATSVSFQQAFGGASPRKQRRERWPRTSWRRSRSGVSPPHGGRGLLRQIISGC
jgi:hypothetical protein